jgi:hypothetical protein
MVTMESGDSLEVRQDRRGVCTSMVPLLQENLLKASHTNSRFISGFAQHLCQAPAYSQIPAGYQGL